MSSSLARILSDNGFKKASLFGSNDFVTHANRNPPFAWMVYTLFELFVLLISPFLIGDRLALKLLFALFDFIADFLAVYTFNIISCCEIIAHTNRCYPFVVVSYLSTSCFFIY